MKNAHAISTFQAKNVLVLRNPGNCQTPRPRQDHPKTTPRPSQDHPKTTPRPSQDHPKTTPRLRKDHSKTTPRPPQDHPKTTSRPRQDHAKATLRPPQDHLKTTPRPRINDRKCQQRSEWLKSFALTVVPRGTHGSTAFALAGCVCGGGGSAAIVHRLADDIILPCHTGIMSNRLQIFNITCVALWV